MKPSFFKNELLADVAYEWRILFAGLWGLADRNGRLEERPRLIKAEVFPHDTLNVVDGLSCLDAVGLITRYTTSTGQRLIAIPCWSKHAKPFSDEPAKFPGPAGNQPTAQLPPAADPTLAFEDDDDEQNRPEKAPFEDREGGLRTLTSTSVLGTLDSSLLPGTSDLSPHGGAARAAEGGPATRSTLVERFERFWQAYPRRQGRGAAFRTWERLKPNDALLERMLAAIAEQRRSHDWLKDGGQYIPHPATWLNNTRWLDEPRVAVEAVSARTRDNLAARDRVLQRIQERSS